MRITEAIEVSWLTLDLTLLPAVILAQARIQWNVAAPPGFRLELRLAGMTSLGFAPHERRKSPDNKIFEAPLVWCR